MSMWQYVSMCNTTGVSQWIFSCEKIEAEIQEAWQGLVPKGKKYLFYMLDNWLIIL